jgi:hypothetical protein
VSFNVQLKGIVLNFFNLTYCEERLVSQNVDVNKTYEVFLRCFLLYVHLNDYKIKHFFTSWGEVQCSLCFINIIMFILPEHQGNWGMQNNTVRILKTHEFTYSILYPIHVNLYFHLPYWSLWKKPILVSPMRFSDHILYIFIIYSSSSSIGTTTLVGFRLTQLSLSILSRKVLLTAVASGTSNPQLGGEPGI